MREGAELLADEVVGGLRGEQKEVVSILQQNSIKLQKLIEDLLNFNIAAAPAAYNSSEPLRLDRIITNVANDHKLSMVAKDIRLQMDIPPVTLEGEPEKLRLVVDNLLSNAVKYSPHGGTIRLALREQGKHVILDVHDSGPGIGPEESSKIFEAFYQGQAPVDGYIKGSGLGLSIAREHTLAHHGRIEALPDSEGAHLRVTLPTNKSNTPMLHNWRTLFIGMFALGVTACSGINTQPPAALSPLPVRAAAPAQPDLELDVLVTTRWWLDYHRNMHAPLPNTLAAEYKSAAAAWSSDNSLHNRLRMITLLSLRDAPSTTRNGRSGCSMKSSTSTASSPKSFKTPPPW